MPKPLHIVRSIAMPFLRDNIDTDLIVRVERLFGAVPREELGRYAFESLRALPDGDHPFDDERFRGAEILLTGTNFGCGSAREGAVWALAGLGVRAVVAPSFGDIFVTNCHQNGMLAVVLPRERIIELARLHENGPPSLIAIDLGAQTVTGSDGCVDGFAIPALRRRALMEGLEDIAMTLTYVGEIAAFGADDQNMRPWAYL